MTTEVSPPSSPYGNDYHNDWSRLLESEILNAWNSGQIEEQLLHYASLTPRTPERVCAIHSYVQFSKERAYQFSHETLSCLLRDLAENPLPELKESALFLLTQFLSTPLSSVEWNAAFALSRSLNCLGDTFSLLIEQIPPLDEATQLVEWIADIAEDTSGFKQLCELFTKHPEKTLDILYDECISIDGDTLPLFDHLIAQSEEEPLLEFISLVQNHLRVDSFYALIQQAPAFHPFALQLLKAHLSEEFPDYPDLGIDELNFALSNGDIDTAIALIHAGVSLDRAGEYPKSGFELYFDWFFENVIVDVPIEKLCELFFSRDSLDCLFENDFYELKLFFYIWRLLLMDSSYQERERNTPKAIAIVETLLKRAQSEPRLAEALGVFLSSIARMQRHNQEAYFDTMMTSPKLASIPSLLRLLPFIAHDENSPNTLFPRVDSENLFLLSDLLPDLDPLPYGFSLSSLDSLLKRNPQVFTELMTAIVKENKTLMHNLWDLRNSKPSLRTDIYFILFSFFAHFEILNEENSDNITSILEDLDQSSHALLFRKCLDENRWDLANRISLFFWELEEEDEPDYNYLKVWKNGLSGYLEQKAPFLTPKIVSEFLQFIICNLDSTSFTLREDDLIIKLLRVIAAHPNHGDLELSFVQLLPDIRRISGLKSSADMVNIAQLTAELGLTEISTSLTNIQEFFNPWPERLFQTPVTSVILLLPQILNISTLEDKKYLASYFQGYFERMAPLPYAYAILLDTHLQKDPLLHAMWQQSPLFRFHHNLLSSETLERVLHDLSPADFCFTEPEPPSLLFYLAELDRSSVQSFMLKHIRDLIAKNISPSDLFQMALRLKCYSVIAYLLDHHHEALTQNDLAHCVQKPPLARLIQLKNSTIENYITQSLKHSHGYGPDEINRMKEELSQSHMSQLISNTYEKNMYSPALSTSCSPRLAIKARGMHSKALSQISKDPLLHTMAQWLQRGSEQPFKTIPLQLLYDYVAEKISKDRFLNAINYIELAPFLTVLLEQLDILKSKLKEHI